MPTPTASRSNRYGIDPFGPIYTSPPTVRTAREAKGAIYPFMSSIVLLWIHVTIPIYSTKVPTVSFPFSVVNNCRQHTRKTVLKYRPNQTPPHLRAHEIPKGNDDMLPFLLWLPYTLAQPTPQLVMPASVCWPVLFLTDMGPPLSPYREKQIQ